MKLQCGRVHGSKTWRWASWWRKVYFFQGQVHGPMVSNLVPQMLKILTIDLCLILNALSDTGTALSMVNPFHSPPIPWTPNQKEGQERIFLTACVVLGSDSMRSFWKIVLLLSSSLLSLSHSQLKSSFPGINASRIGTRENHESTYYVQMWLRRWQKEMGCLEERDSKRSRRRDESTSTVAQE